MTSIDTQIDFHHQLLQNSKLTEVNKKNKCIKKYRIFSIYQLAIQGLKTTISLKFPSAFLLLLVFLFDESPTSASIYYLKIYDCKLLTNLGSMYCFYMIVQLFRIIILEVTRLPFAHIYSDLSGLKF